MSQWGYSRNESKRNARAEARAWAGLKVAEGDWLLHDIVDWRRRLDADPYFIDLKVEKVKFYVDILLSRLTQHGAALQSTEVET